MRKSDPAICIISSALMATHYNIKTEDALVLASKLPTRFFLLIFALVFSRLDAASKTTLFSPVGWLGVLVFGSKSFESKFIFVYQCM